MKKIISLILAVIMITGLCMPVKVNAGVGSRVVMDEGSSVELGDEEVVYAKLTYRYLSYYNKAVVTGLTNGEKATVAIIPSEIMYNGELYQVTQIEKEAFEYCTSLVRIDIPDSVTYINEYAFHGCENLKNVQLPNNLQWISEGMFEACSSLVSIDIPDSVSSIRHAAFWGCTNLTSVKMSQNLQKIAQSAFGDCTNLSYIKIPDNNVFIGASAFANCVSLSIDLPDTVIIEETKSKFFPFIGVANVNYKGDSEDAPWGAKALNGYIEGEYVYADNSKKKLLTFRSYSEGMYSVPNGVTCISEKCFSHDGLIGPDVKCIYVPESVVDMSGVFDECYYDDEVIVYGVQRSYVESYVKNLALENIKFSSLENLPITSNGIYTASLDRNGINAGFVTSTLAPVDKEYRWSAYNKTTGTTEVVSDWTLNNEWLDWKPDTFGEYILTAEARVKGNTETAATASTEAFEYNPHIKGKCQMPYYGEGGGYLIGVESYENPNQEYYYEMLILDCSLLAEGKDAWVYTTGKYRVDEGNAGWCIWQPEYGYYWTLFRVYDADGNMIDQACYGFANAY